jgi:hypothetical protein
VLGCGGRCSRVVVALVAMADFSSLFQPLIVTFVSTGDAVDHSVTKSTVTSGQRK